MKHVRFEVFRQVALYSGVGKDELADDALLCEDLGMDPLTILMLLVTLAEVLGRDIFTLQFELQSLTTVDRLVMLFQATETEMDFVSDTQIRYCINALH